MKCNNCNSEIVNGAEFCGNCGTKIVQPQNNVTPPNPVPTNKKNNKKLFIILGIILAVIIAIVVIVIIVNKNSKFEDPFEDIDNLTSLDISDSTKEHKEVNSFVKNIEEDYSNGNLSKDDYIMQLAYSIYDTSKLNYKYKTSSLDFNNPTELFEKAFSMKEELSNDTLVYIFEKYTLSDVVWDVEEDATVSGTSNNELYDYEVMPLVDKDANLSKLNNVILSSNKNFLVYYTTDGTNAITKAQAEKIASFLESTVGNYKSKFGLDYNYKAQYDFWSSSALSTCPTGSAKGKACKVLKKNNIDIKYLDTAMPVFIIDTDAENTGALGYYVPPIGGLAEVVLKVSDIFDDMGTQMDNIMTTYSFPFFVVSSSLDDFDDTKIVLAHELFHHYQKYICGNGGYGECTSTNFTVETTADYAASSVAGVNKTGTAINGHAGMFIADIDSSLDKIGYKDYGDSGLGYGAFVFAHNYASAVSNGYTHLFDSMKTADTLKYLYDKSGGKYKDILITTAKKSLTLDYSNKLLIGNEDGKVLYPKNYKDIGKTNNTQTININYSSMNYYYISPQDYGAESQLSFNGNSNNLTLLLFIKENNSYKYLHTHSLNKEFVINIDEFSNYQEIAIGIVNSEISGTLSYSYELNNSGTKTPTITAKDLNLTTLEDVIDNYSSFVCHQIEEDSEYKTVTQVKLSFDKKDKISDMYFKGTIQMKNYDPENPAFAIAQKVVSGLLLVMQQTYEEQFKYFRVITEEGTDKYSVTFKITKNYYDALNNSINLNGEDKYSIVKSIQEEGFTCKFEK